MSAQDNLGKLITGDACKDAIHIALCPVIATDHLAPGQEIGFVEPGNYEKVGISKKPLGIVDPFLRTSLVAPGERFYMFLFPNTITGLQHHWDHPDFPSEEEHQNVDASERWLREWAEEIMGQPYTDALAQLDDVQNQAEDWRYVTTYGTSISGAIDSEVWRHYEIIRGKKVDEAVKAETTYSCTC